MPDYDVFITSTLVHTARMRVTAESQDHADEKGKEAFDAWVETPEGEAEVRREASFLDPELEYTKRAGPPDHAIDDAIDQRRSGE